MATKDIAYDLSIYEDKNAILKPAKKHTRNSPVKVDPLKEKQKRNAKQRAADRKKKEHTALIARICCIAIMVVILVAVTIYSKIILSETISDIDSQTSLLEELKSEETQLKNVIDQKIKRKKIEEYATKELGLVKMETQQRQTVNATSGDNVQIAEYEEKISIFERVLALFKGDSDSSVDSSDNLDEQQDQEYSSTASSDISASTEESSVKGEDETSEINE